MRIEYTSRRQRLDKVTVTVMVTVTDGHGIFCFSNNEKKREVKDQTRGRIFASFGARAAGSPRCYRIT
jgi:hypothetical protein